MNDLATKELYISPNGDCWHLCRDASGYVFVLHQANIPSGGQTSRIELSDFLARDCIAANDWVSHSLRHAPRSSVGARHGESSHRRR